MKKIGLLLAALGLSLSLLQGATSAQAASQVTQSAQIVESATAVTAVLPPDVGGWKFWSYSVCVDGSAINGAYYRVAQLAQQWNLRAPIMQLDYSDDCAADGYPPSRRMVVGSYNNPSDATCWRNTNNQTSTVNGMKRWTNGPAIYINFGQPSCIQGQARRDHVVSAVIGWVLGLNFLNSTGYNSRVMNMTAFSWDNVGTPDTHSGDTLNDIYGYAYCDPGTLC